MTGISDLAIALKIYCETTDCYDCAFAINDWCDEVFGLSDAPSNKKLSTTEKNIITAIKNKRGDIE